VAVKGSADVSLHLILLGRKALPREELDHLLGQARERGVSLESLLSQQLPAEQLQAALRTRNRHASTCQACQAATYLLPNESPQKTPCEHCGAMELLPPAPTGRMAGPGKGRPPARGRPRGRPGGRRPTGRRPRLRPRGPRPAPPRPRPEPAWEPPVPVEAVAAEDDQPPAASDYGYESLTGQAPAPPGADDYQEFEEPLEATPVAGTPIAGIHDEHPADHEVPEQDDDRARRLRQAGAGFGYEPSEPEPRPRASARLGQVPSEAFEDPPAEEAPPADDVPDSRFAMPEAHRAPPEDPDRPRFGPPPGAEPKRIPPITESVAHILAYPVQNRESVALVTMGALFIMFLSLIPVWVMIKWIPVLALAVGYPFAYLVSVTEGAMQGREEVPGWPEFAFLEHLFMVLRLAVICAACFAPALLVGCLLFGTYLGMGDPPAPDPLWTRTVGSEAASLAPKDPEVGEDVSVAAITFLDAKTEAEVSLKSDKWTILALVSKDTGEEIGGEMGREEARSQVYDIERVGRAMDGDVRVLAVYADTANKLIYGQWHWAVPDEVRERFEEDSSGYGDDEYYDEYDDEEYYDEDYEDFDSREDIGDGLDDAQGRAGLIGGNLPPDPNYLDTKTSPFEHVQILRHPEFLWPEPFNKNKRLPAVFLIDPDGVIQREYSRGVYDEALYADLSNLRLGGDGHTMFSKPLPPAARGLEAPSSVVAGAGIGLVLLLLAAGFVYYPMALLLMAGFNTATASLLYPAGFRAIGVALKDYMALGAILLAASMIVGPTLEFAVRFGLSLFLPAWLAFIFSSMAQAWVTFYAQLVTAYGVGRYFYANQKRIGWFEKGGSQIDTDWASRQMKKFGKKLLRGGAGGDDDGGDDDGGGWDE
jgi:hypothetical protein